MQSELITGSVERVTYHNEENGYCVIKVRVKGHRDAVTIVGHAAAISAGEFVEAQGGWINHREFGVQFQSKALKTVHPSTLEGIEKYLGSGMIKGIGPQYAKRMVTAFGLEVFDIIEKTPRRLSEVSGIGPVRIKKILSAWQDQKVIREIMVFLQSHGVGTGRAVRIFKTYGAEAIERVKANPYHLAKDIQGIGFRTADQIAGNLGVPRDSMQRARAGIHFALSEQISNGHCAFPKEELIAKAQELLEIDAEVLRNALEEELQSDHLIAETIEGVECLYPISLFRWECNVTELLQERMEGVPPWGELDVEKALPWVESKLQIQLADLQREAVRTALKGKILIITGGPGTGKTTLTKAIVTVLAAKRVTMALCSPTGRAAKRLSECTGMEAKTIHRLLKFDGKMGGFTHDESNPLEIDLLLLDEASMVDLSLMNSLLKAIPKKASILIVGDVDQIPSVGPGAVLASLIDSTVIPTVRLTQIFRQAAQSQIVSNAHRINQGQMPDFEAQDEKSDFYYVAGETPEEIVPKIIELVKERIPRRFGFHAVREIQVVCPMNRAGLGARSLNVELQKALNPDAIDKVERFGTTFATGDKVMVTTNDYDKEVFNGDIGYIQSIDKEEQELIVEIDGRGVAFEFGELDILTLAYATTIHKSQGSEYPAVVLPVAMQHFMMLKRNILYTGVTRGKKLVVLIGQKKAVAIAVKSANQGKRWNKLADRLRGLLRASLSQSRSVVIKPH